MNSLDLSQHLSILSVDKINKIVAPLKSAFNIKHFRYLKIYNNGSRLLLSNFTDSVRFFYEMGHYKNMWFDGEFPEHLVDGWHLWDVMRTLQCNAEITPFEKEINYLLGLYHGMTFISKGIDFYEIYTFDTDKPDIYLLDKKIFLRFILYFKDKARKLIRNSEEEKLIIPLKQPLISHDYHPNKNQMISFMNNTRVKRYYLSGKYAGVYLTEKEAQCIYWMIQGKTTEDIAIIENNSLRTIETHLENVRRKLNCYKQTQLVRIILDAGIF